MVELSKPPTRSRLLAIGLADACCADLARVFTGAGLSVDLKRLPADASAAQFADAAHGRPQLLVCSEEVLREGDDARLAPFAGTAIAVILPHYDLARAITLTMAGVREIVARTELERLVPLLLRERTPQAPLPAPADLADRVETAREHERERIARDLHDDLGGSLVALKIEASLLAARLGGEAPMLRERLQGIGNLVDEAIAAMGRVVRALRPGLLDDLELGAAIARHAEDFSSRTGIACCVRDVDRSVELPPVSSTGVFRVFQEALTNVCKHARASSVEVRLRRDGDTLALEVRDDGIGPTPGGASDAGRAGLHGMRERAQALGGTFEWLPARPRGTCLRLSLPLAATAPSLARHPLPEARP